MTWRRILLGLALTLISVSVCLPTELNNPGFEETSADRATAWTPYGRGYALEATEVQSGKFAVCCETTGDQDGMGIAQVSQAAVSGGQHVHDRRLHVRETPYDIALLGWMTYGFQADGLLFWHVNLWHPNRIIDSGDPYLAWKPVCVANMTGDGCLTYPTPAGPVSSIRLENIRDGLEDYDYLALLADAQGQEAAIHSKPA